MSRAASGASTRCSTRRRLITTGSPAPCPSAPAGGIAATCCAGMVSRRARSLLDVGSGTGVIAALAQDMVGPTGVVVGGRPVRRHAGRSAEGGRARYARRPRRAAAGRRRRIRHPDHGLRAAPRRRPGRDLPRVPARAQAWRQGAAARDHAPRGPRAVQRCSSSISSTSCPWSRASCAARRRPRSSCATTGTPSRRACRPPTSSRRSQPRDSRDVKRHVLNGMFSEYSAIKKTRREPTRERPNYRRTADGRGHRRGAQPRAHPGGQRRPGDAAVRAGAIPAGDSIPSTRSKSCSRSSRNTASSSRPTTPR